VARRTDKHARAHRPLRLTGAAVQRGDGAFVTRTVPAGTSVKAYTCPGCHRPIAPGLAHLVAWPAVPPLGSSTTIEHRRHWHTACWSARR